MTLCFALSLSGIESPYNSFISCVALSRIVSALSLHFSAHEIYPPIYFCTFSAGVAINASLVSSMPRYLIIVPTACLLSWNSPYFDIKYAVRYSGTILFLLTLIPTMCCVILHSLTLSGMRLNAPNLPAFANAISPGSSFERMMSWWTSFGMRAISFSFKNRSPIFCTLSKGMPPSVL